MAGSVVAHCLYSSTRALWTGYPHRHCRGKQESPDLSCGDTAHEGKRQYMNVFMMVSDDAVCDETEWPKGDF